MNTTTKIHSFTIEQMKEVCDTCNISYNEEDANGRMINSLISKIVMAGWDIESAVQHTMTAAQRIKEFADAVIEAINENRVPTAQVMMAREQERMMEHTQEAEAKRAEIMTLIHVAAQSVADESDRRSFSKALKSVAFGSAS